MPKPMLGSIGALMAAATCLVPASSAVARTTKMLEPATKWTVDWSAEVCTLRRGFGDPQKPDILSFQRFGPTNEFQLFAVSDDLPRGFQRAPAGVRLGNKEPMSVDGGGVTARDGRPGLLISSTSLVDRPKGHAPEDPWPQVTVAEEAAVTSVTLEVGGRSIGFHTGALDKPFAALRACTDDLVKSWGLDPALQASLSRKPIPVVSPANWITSSDYPVVPLMAGKQALVSFRVMVDPTGMPSSCKVQRSYNDPQFDQVTCAALMRRARFLPALDAAGHPVASYYLNSVRWIDRL